MHFDDADAAPLKHFIVKKLQDAESDVDSDVLADYVLALVKTDDAEPVAKANVVRELHDFLGDGAVAFVDAAFAAIAARAYDPSKPPLRPSAPVYAPPRRSNEARKRSYPEAEGDVKEDGEQNGRGQSYERGGERPTKAMRRGGRGGHETHGGSRQSQHFINPHSAAPPSYPLQTQQMHLPSMVPPPPGMPPFDPNDPQAAMAAMMAMSQLMGLPMPDLSQPDPSPNYTDASTQRTGQRCIDYDTKGFCARGVACQFEHGDDPYVVSQQNDEYDPSTTAIYPTPTRTGQVDTFRSDRGRGGRGRGRANYRGGAKRSEFSHIGQNHNRSVTCIVVESIPEEHFSESSVRDFFSEFGMIEEVTMQPYKRLAIIRYDSHNAAKAAYDSPKSVFDNRFVKVYWYKSDALPQPSNGHAGSQRDTTDVEMKSEEPAFDAAEVAKKQEEAQRKHDVAKQQREAASKQKADLDAKLKTMEVERKKMAELLAKKAGKVTSSPVLVATEESEQTKLLKAQLAKLEAEAKSLGIDPDAPSSQTNGFDGPPPTYTPRGRGAYRARAPRGGRAGYQPAYRGAYAYAASRAKLSLDNRPKTIAITFSEGRYEDHEEALRQYLMFNSLESAVLSKHPGREDAAVVAFQQRFEGENFLVAAKSDLGGPLAGAGGAGKVEVVWFTPAPLGGTSAATTNGSTGSGQGDVGMEAEVTGSAGVGEAEGKGVARDLDTYDEEHDDMDRWG